MKCLRCGQKIEEGEAFCLDCRMEMEKYPVSPNASIQLPKREAPANPKRHHRTPLTTEEQLKQLRKRNRLLLRTLAALMLVLAAVCFYLARHLQTHTRHAVGQNYSSVTVTSDGED